MEQTPTVGRIVHVRTDAAQPLKPLLITHVHDPSMVSGVLFDAFAPTVGLARIRQGTGIGEWCWPPRV